MWATQGPKRYHHTLPRLYLKGFVEKEGSAFIWEYRKNSPTIRNPQRQSIGRPCATRDYYAHVADDGTIDFERLENQLERFEKRSDAIFKKLRATVLLSASEKSEFAFYLTQMLWRIPRQRERLAELLPRAVEAVQPRALQSPRQR